MAESKLIAEELMSLYEELPELVIYKSDFLAVEKSEYIEEVIGTSGGEDLNPLDVVLESLINVLSEKLSTDTITQSKSMVYINKSIKDLAAQEVASLVKKDSSFLKEIHTKWLEGLRNFVAGLRKRGVRTIQEATFQVCLKFRISASSSLKAMASITK